MTAPEWLTLAMAAVCALVLVFVAGVLVFVAGVLVGSMRGRGRHRGARVIRAR